ncbi:MAG: VIT domain-containing protein [Anaerolineales bacterium]|jgi:Ca-activated chloride channel family protein
MRRLKPCISALLLTLLCLAFAAPAQADGIIIPDPPICHPDPCPPEPIPFTQLAIEYHRVTVTIEDQVAVTKVDQVFRNDNDWEVEGTYIFPIPLDASVTSFTLWMDGEPVEGEVLTREQARQTYEEIVRTMRDPALLEYADRGAVQASIYPIPSGGSRRIELEYTQVLVAESGLLHYVYPLSPEKYSVLPLEQVSISVSVSSPQAIRAVYSPSHPLAIDREDDHYFAAGYEASNVLPDRDFELYYSVAEDEIGLNLLTYRDPFSDDRDGFFLLLAAPSVEVDREQAIPKDVIFVLDQSGSMEGEKFRQAQQAVAYVLDHLNRDDRFSVIAFSTGTRHYSDTLRSTSAVADAKRWVNSLAAQGATDINRALLEAVEMAHSERPTILIFLTDGLPTEGVQERDAILDNLRSAAPANIRLFAFGVGYDVDTFLLDLLAQDHHGAASYVTPGQALDEAISAFYAKVSNPVLTDLELDLGDVTAYDLHPSPLPDLFAGSQLVLVGRYTDPGSTSVTLSGTIDGRIQTFEYPEQFFRGSGGPDFLPRLWATRKIGSLLQQIRLTGPVQELVDQIVSLSIRYGIVTEYTSYLVTEPEFLGADAMEEMADQAFQDMLALPPMASGQPAVERSQAEAEIGGADSVLAPSGEAADLVQLVGTRTFRLVDGVWIDTAFDPETMSTTRVPFLSDDYFALAGSSSDLGAAFALGSRVIAIWNDTAYEVIDPDLPGDPITIPPMPTADPITGALPGEQPVDAQSPSGSEGRGLISFCPSLALPLALITACWGWRTARGSKH